jgi:hypothetical protein
VKREVQIRSGPLDHRGSWAIDLEYFRYRDLEESRLDHVQTPDMQGQDLIITVDQRESVTVDPKGTRVSRLSAPGKSKGRLKG